MPPSNDNPLAGRRIVVTRPAAQAVRFGALLEAHGAVALRYPAIVIAPPSDADALKRVLAALASFDVAVFVSPTAVREGLKQVATWPAGVRVAAVGPGTCAELERHGIRSTLTPAAGADTDALLADPGFNALDARSVVIFRGEGGRERLRDALLARGARVACAECYRRESPSGLARLAGEWQRAPADAVTVFSAGALRNLLEALPSLREALVATPLFVSHARIAQAAHALGLRTVTVSGPGEEEMLGGLLAYFSARK